MKTKLNIHYVLMAQLTINDLKSSYKSYQDFKDTHNITKELEAKVLGANYFFRNPIFSNSSVISKFLKYFSIKAKIVTTFSKESVQFNIKKI